MQLSQAAQGGLLMNLNDVNAQVFSFGNTESVFQTCVLQLQPLIVYANHFCVELYFYRIEQSFIDNFASRALRSNDGE